MTTTTRKPILAGRAFTCDDDGLVTGSQPEYLRGPGWIVRMFTRAGVEQYARREAAKRRPAGFWTGIVTDAGTHWNVHIAGQPFTR